MTNLPLTGIFTITAYFKKVNSTLWPTLGYHTGIDFIGSDNIYATCDGVVDTKGVDGSFGNYIIIKEDGINRYHYFCHLSKFNVEEGDRVNRSSIIGVMGSTGHVTGKHLHYEIRNAKVLRADTLINPAEHCGIPNAEGTYNSANYQITPPAPIPNMMYAAHCQNLGWQEEKRNGDWAGLLGQGLRVEALIINADINIQYRVHMAGKGWSDWVPNGCMAGTIGESRAIEAIEIQSSRNVIVGQAYVENIGYQNEVRGTQITIGTTGQALRIEAFRLKFE